MNVDRRTASLAIATAAVLACVPFASCGDETRRASQAATPTPCPTPSAAQATADDVSFAIVGAFSAECARDKVSWPFELPSVTSTHEPPVFRIPQPRDPTVVYASYKPIGGAPPLRIEIFHDHPTAGTASEFDVGDIGVYLENTQDDPTPTERTAYWTQARVTYLLIAQRKNASSESVDEFLKSTAKAMIEQGAVPQAPNQ